MYSKLDIYAFILDVYRKFSSPKMTSLIYFHSVSSLIIHILYIAVWCNMKYLFCFPVHSSFTTYYRVCNQINTTGATRGAGTAYPSGAPEFTSGFQWGSCYSIFSFIYMFCRSLFVLLYFFFCPLCCLFFFDIRILIAPQVSSNYSYSDMYHCELLID